MIYGDWEMGHDSVIMPTKALEDGWFSSGTVTRFAVRRSTLTEAAPRLYVRQLTSII
jgi:hypothetical protein